MVTVGSVLVVNHRINRPQGVFVAGKFHTSSQQHAALPGLPLLMSHEQLPGQEVRRPAETERASSPPW